MVFKLVMGIGLVALALYSALTVYVYSNQRDYIYRSPALTETEFVELAKDTFGGSTQVLEPFKALIIEPPAGTQVKSTAVWFHGSAGLNIDRYGVPRRLLGRGHRAVMPEYPGFGVRSAERISEQGLVNDAVQLLLAVHKNFPAEPIEVYGESLGSGVAIQALKKFQELEPSANVSRLVLITPFDSLEKAAAKAMWYLPVKLLLKDKFDSVAHIKGVNAPIMILAAEQDDVVGRDAARILAEAAGKPVRLKVLTDSGHITWWDKMTEEDWDDLAGKTLYPEILKEMPIKKPRTYVF